VHVAPAGAPAWAMRLCQGIHVIFLPSKVVEYTAQAAAPPVLTYMRAPVEVLDSFTYLVVEISSRSAFAAASIGRAASAQRAALALQHRCHAFFLFFGLFFTEGVLTKAAFENKVLRHNAASHV